MNKVIQSLPPGMAEIYIFGAKMVKANNWPVIIFFAVTTAGAVVGAPLYISRFGVSLSEVLLFSFFVIATGFAITAGYHRLFAHRAFKANKFIQFLVLFFGAAAFEQSALTWCSGHRDHHRFVDTERDPYSIKKGFWYAHIGWMTLWKQWPDYSNVKDLLQNRLVRHQHDYYVAWGVASGILLPVLLGALSGHALGAFVFSVCLRLTLVYHATFCINSVCHTFGKATYDIHSTAKDNWITAFFTNGEGYHNFHHRFPADYRNGVRWYQWDPSKWLIVVLEKLGLVRDLKRTDALTILQTKKTADLQRATMKLPIDLKPKENHMKKIVFLSLAFFAALSLGSLSFAEDMKEMEGKEMSHAMMKSMMEKYVVPTSDGGIVIVAGNKITKYDKDLNVVKEAEVKVDMEAMKKNMSEMMKMCPMMGGMKDMGDDPKVTGETQSADDHSAHH